MTGPDERDPRAHRAWRIAAVGTVAVGTSLAVVAAAAGAGGRLGLAFFLLGALLSCTLGTLYAVGTGVVDAYRGDPVGRARVVVAVVLGVASLLLPVMVIGLASA